MGAAPAGLGAGSLPAGVGVGVVLAAALTAVVLLDELMAEGQRRRVMRAAADPPVKGRRVGLRPARQCVRTGDRSATACRPVDRRPGHWAVAVAGAPS